MMSRRSLVATIMAAVIFAGCGDASTQSDETSADQAASAASTSPHRSDQPSLQTASEPTSQQVEGVATPTQMEIGQASSPSEDGQIASQRENGQSSSEDDSRSPIITQCKTSTDGTNLMLDVRIQFGESAPPAEGYALIYSINSKAGITEVKQELLAQSPWQGKEACEGQFGLNFQEPGGAVALYGIQGLHDSIPARTTAFLGGFQARGSVGIHAQLFAFADGDWKEISAPFSNED